MRKVGRTSFADHKGVEMGVSEHRFLKVRRTLVDVSSAAARRDGILMYRPGSVAEP